MCPGTTGMRMNDKSLKHGRQSWGGWEGYIPPCFWEGGDGQCFHPPLEMNEALAHLNYLIY